MKIILSGEYMDHTGKADVVFEFENVGSKSLVKVWIKDECVEVTVGDLRKALRVFG